jgi:alkylation response protein AidB-like acyl-CoA dehydrogenase
VLANQEIARAKVPGVLDAIGVGMLGPTIIAHGSEEQKSRYLGAMLHGDEVWCQLFSEPAAGSDLAAVQTRARQQDDGSWRLSGQKVWTTNAQFASYGLLLARTDADVPKHKGLTMFVVPMDGEGVTIRGLRQISGEAEFNEVFFDEVFVPADHLVGGLNQGWSVANTTLAHERGTNFPFKEQVVHEVYLGELLSEAARLGRLDEPHVVDQLAQAYVELAVLRLHNWRTLSRLSRGLEPGPESSWVKLAWTDLTQHLSDAALDVVGPGSPLWGKWQRQWLWSKAASIAGGTSEIQRTIIGDRILGLPR